MKLWAVMAVASAAMCWVSEMSVAGEKTIILREYVGQSWSNQLVTYTFEAGKGQCDADSARITGPGGPVACQFSDVELWPGSRFVKAAKLSFVVAELTPLTRNTYTVTFSDKGEGAAPASDVKVASGDKTAELESAACGVRILAGEKVYDAPAAAADVPGPLAGVRMPDGSWAGGSRLYGKAAVKSYSSKITANGPVFARAEMVYVYADGNKLSFIVQVTSGDNGALWDMHTDRENLDAGLEFTLGAAPGADKILMPKGPGQWARKDRAMALAVSMAGTNLLVTPRTHITQIFPWSASAVSIAPATGGGEIVVRSRDAGAWVDPVPYTYSGSKSWNLGMIEKLWTPWQKKGLGILCAQDKTIGLRVSLAQGARKWGVWTGEPKIGEQLNVVKDYVLEWPQGPNERNPRLFVTRDEAQSATAKLTPGSAANLRIELAKLGDYDVMRGCFPLVGSYDNLIDSAAVSEQERPLLRAQMAYLGYVMADPGTWSQERGYCSGNPNMSCSYTLARGIIACVIPDHPMAKTWAAQAVGWMDTWLAEEVGPAGEWMCEGMHYGQVSMSPMTAFAVAARNAGYHDFFGDERFRRVLLYFSRMYGPPDVQRGNVRCYPTVGRGFHAEIWCHDGIAAKATAKSYPDYSKVMQWAWLQAGKPQHDESYLGGFEAQYMDATLPAEQPDWGSELIPNLCALFRSGLGTSNENYVLLLSAVDSMRNLDVWTPNVGSLATWYAKGRKVSAAFFFDGSYASAHELTRDGVMLARNHAAGDKAATPFGYYTKTAVEGFAALPAADYVRGTYTITKPDDRDWLPDALPSWPKVKAATEPQLAWTRQALCVRDANPTGASYMVFLDTTEGGQPTEWQFRSVSEKLGEASKAADMDKFLADKPGDKPVDAREIKGDRFTAAGTTGVDLEFFVANPTDTPRHTIRYGGQVGWLKLPDFRDFLNLQLPGDGHYLVAVFPHERKEPAPTFARLGDGKVIKVAGSFGTDYVFLSHESASAKAERAAFEGTAASVQDRPATGVALTLSAGGSVTYQKYTLASASAACLKAEPAALTLVLPADHKGVEVTIAAPGNWSAPKGVELKTNDKKQKVLTIPAGTTTVRLN